MQVSNYYSPQNKEKAHYPGRANCRLSQKRPKCNAAFPTNNRKVPNSTLSVPLSPHRHSKSQVKKGSSSHDLAVLWAPVKVQYSKPLHNPRPSNIFSHYTALCHTVAIVKLEGTCHSATMPHCGYSKVTGHVPQYCATMPHCGYGKVRGQVPQYCATMPHCGYGN